MNRIFLGLLALLIFSCTSGNTKTSNRTELWRVTLETSIGDLPFFLAFTSPTEAYAIAGTDTIILKDVRRDSLSFSATFPYFQSTINGTLQGPDFFTGTWERLNCNCPVKLSGELNKPFFFSTTTTESPAYTQFQLALLNQDDTTPAYGSLSYTPELLTGTISTETGDFRHLYGHQDGTTLRLAGFDGGSGILLTGTSTDTSLFTGLYTYAGSEATPIVAYPDSTQNLRDPFSITPFRPSIDTIRVINSKGDNHTFTANDFFNKVTVIDVMGSWCHNCLDASRFLDTLAQQYPQDKLTILPIAFERSDSFELSRPAINHFFGDLKKNPSWYFGGKASQENIFETFSFLESFHSYPTFIFINKQGLVAGTFTGFYGPNTGSNYSHFSKKIFAFTDSLIQGSSTTSGRLSASDTPQAVR